MGIAQRIEAFSKLGEFLSQFTTAGIIKKDNTPANTLYFDAFKMQIERAHEFNGWFTKDNVLFAFENWSKLLNHKNLTSWISNYQIAADKASKNIAIVMAGNIPLVGFHDFLCVLICGDIAQVKLSSNDKHFLPLIARLLAHYDTYFKDKIIFTEKKLTNFDAVIATGSTNTARYFEHYFGKYPHIIRKSRNSVAIISGEETKEELELLGEDIFRYFGLGCRSISKIFVPKNYDFDLLFNALYKFNDIINYKKYENNYDYNKAVYIMSLFNILENGFFMLKEDTNYSSPIATVFYEYYESLSNLKNRLASESEQIQCIASNENLVEFVKFGDTQRPKLWSYADGIDTIEFLLKI